MKINFIIALVFFSNLFGYGQKLKIEQGDFNFIKGQKEINVEFVYDNMKLLKKNLSNEDYVKEHSAELEEKTRGKGTSWEKSWYASRELIYAPKFLELMNRYLYEDHKVFFAENLKDTKYTLIVDTVWEGYAKTGKSFAKLILKKGF